MAGMTSLENPRVSFVVDIYVHVFIRKYGRINWPFGKTRVLRAKSKFSIPIGQMKLLGFVEKIV